MFVSCKRLGIKRWYDYPGDYLEMSGGETRYEGRRHPVQIRRLEDCSRRRWLGVRVSVHGIHVHLLFGLSRTWNVRLVSRLSCFKMSFYDPVGFFWEVRIWYVGLWTKGISHQDLKWRVLLLLKSRRYKPHTVSSLVYPSHDVPNYR